MTALLGTVPFLYRMLALAALAVALLGFGWLKGAEYGERKLDAAQAASLKEGARIVVVRGAVTEKIVTKYLPAITKIETITETIVKEVNTYVPPSDPAVSGGFRVYHDAAAAGRVPDASEIPHAAPASAQTAAATVAENYGACRADQERLRGLQEWVTEQGKVK